MAGHGEDLNSEIFHRRGKSGGTYEDAGKHHNYSTLCGACRADSRIPKHFCAARSGSKIPANRGCIRHMGAPSNMNPEINNRRRVWEQDIRNRQRNIVFPDTLLNTVRGYRNILSGRMKLNALQRFCMIMLGFMYLIPFLIAVRMGFDVFRSLSGWGLVIGIPISLFPDGMWLIIFCLGFKMLLRALLPSSAFTPEAARQPAVPGIIRRRFSQRPGRRKSKGPGQNQKS